MNRLIEACLSDRARLSVVRLPRPAGVTQSEAGALPTEVPGLAPAKGPRRGFTLIELMIVIGIIAIIVTTGVPPFVRAMRKEGLRKAVSDMVEACSHARGQAILRGTPTELIIRAENGQITVRPLAVRTAEEAPEAVGGELAPKPAAAAVAPFSARLADDIAIKLLYVNFEDQMEMPEAHVRFFPNGTCDEFTVILASPTGEQKISLDVVTALADVMVIR